MDVLAAAGRATARCLHSRKRRARNLAKGQGQRFAPEGAPTGTCRSAGGSVGEGVPAGAGGEAVAVFGGQFFEAGVKPWDIAAGILLVREAGGRVCDFHGRGDRLLDSGQIIAGNLKISEVLQKTVYSTNYAAAFSA